MTQGQIIEINMSALDAAQWILRGQTVTTETLLAEAQKIATFLRG
jgi:hypothetical protein